MIIRRSARRDHAHRRLRLTRRQAGKESRLHLGQQGIRFHFSVPGKIIQRHQRLEIPPQRLDLTPPGSGIERTDGRAEFTDPVHQLAVFLAAIEQALKVGFFLGRWISDIQQVSSASNLFHFFRMHAQRLAQAASGW